MTRTRAAADAALPSDRRSFLGNSLALASIITASATVPAIAGEHPDAELLALGREWEASVDREVVANKADLAAEERYVSPPWPDAVYWRPDEIYRSGFIFPETDEDDRPTGRHRYGHIGGAAHFRGVVRSLEGRASLDEYDARELARAKEIVSAFDEWEAEDTRRHQASGYEQTTAALRQEVKHNRELIWRIVRTPARTLDGIFLKARAILWTQCYTVRELEADWLETSHDPNEAKQDTGLLLDILHLSGATHAAGSAVRT